MKQEVHEDPLNNRVGYKTEFTLSCIKKKDVFLFGEKLTEVDYYCNRRYIFLSLLVYVTISPI